MHSIGNKVQHVLRRGMQECKEGKLQEGCKNAGGKLLKLWSKQGHVVHGLLDLQLLNGGSSCAVAQTYSLSPAEFSVYTWTPVLVVRQK